MSGAVCFAEVCSEATELFMQFAFALYRAHAMVLKGDQALEHNQPIPSFSSVHWGMLCMSLKLPQARLGPAMLNEMRRRFPVPRVGRSG